MFASILRLFNELESLADPRVEKWFLMSSPFVPVAIVSFYFYFIFIFGPRFMQNRKAFEIKKIIILYNIAQVIFNAYLFKNTIYYIVVNLHMFKCFKVEYGDTPSAYFVRSTNWLFAINKLMDLLDTIFFVLKKKQSHVTFLHVYHHVLTFVGCWMFAKYYPGGQLVVLGALNSFVHCVMYLYYLLSLFEQFKRIGSFVKKPITQMQIMQFVLAGIHGTYGLTDESCNYPRALIYFGLVQAFLMIYLFINFYRKTYLKSRKIVHQNGTSMNGFAKKQN